MSASRNSLFGARTVALRRIKIVFLATITVLVVVVEGCGPGRGIGGPRRGRKLTPLVYKEHVPNMSENSLGASGLSEGKITRNDTAFNNLVPNYNRDIMFKDDEGSGADRQMTQRCKEKLNTLAWSVMNQWPGVKLRVIEAWDEEQLHGVDSLHYEGRAVDITTSDKDKSKYGMLARLAVEAGFDWVFYESRGYIHCSVKSDSSQASHSSGCFSGDSTVLTDNGERRRLSELRLGEKVLSMNKDGQPIFSEVLMFMDRETSQKREFVRIRTENGAEISVTPAHLLLSTSTISSQNVQRRNQYVFADRLEEGDFLLVSVNGSLVPQKITKISSQLSRGVYAPLTNEGTIIVDNVVASCYALVDSQFVAHLSFMPIRFYTIVKRLLYFSDNALSSSTTIPSSSSKTVVARSRESVGSSKNSSNSSRLSEDGKNEVIVDDLPDVQSGIHWYAKTLYSIKDFILPSSWIYQ